MTKINEANRELILNYLNMLGLFFVAIAAISGLLIVFRLKSDEKKDYLDILHSKRVSKTRLDLSYFGVGTVVSMVVFTGTLAGAFFIGNSTLDDPLATTYFWQTMLELLPLRCSLSGSGASSWAHCLNGPVCSGSI